MRPVIGRQSAPPEAPHHRFAPDPTPEARPRALYDGEPAACRRDLRHFLPIWAHLGLILAVAWVYRLEGRAFLLLLATAVVALPVHYYLPFRLKKRFFIAASLAGLGLVFGPSCALVVAAVGAALVGICYLPIPWIGRVGLIASAAALLASARAGLVAVPLPDAAWPLIATMFMFRMVIYLYELKHARGPERVEDALGYFFLLPNYCFLHFPVVDYKTWLRGYFAADIHAIQRSGLRMMVRGTTHLLIYRLVYHELLIRPEEVHGPASLVGYLACNYLLYLRVSGQFHLACGMLHLFGFQLPETHHHYLLASSFTDYWRRINIYWKDFMVRVVFNPVVFRLKRWPQARALAVATIVVFVATWGLHAYQSFWLRGTWGFSLPDALFWGILGALVLVNVQVDAKAVRRRARGLDRSPRALAIRSLKTLGTLATITLLWSLWSSPSVGAWVAMLRRGSGLG